MSTSRFVTSVLSCLLVGSLASFAAGCGGTAENTVPPGNGNNQDSGGASQDSSVSSQDSGKGQADASTDGTEGGMNAGDTGMNAGDAGMDANIPPPSTTPVALGDNLQLWGVTDDGYAVYSDETANILYALSLTGTTPITIASNLNGDAGAGVHYVSISHNVVFISIDPMGSGIANLFVWTSTAETPKLVATASTAFSFFPQINGVASPDSSLITYFDNFDGMATADLVGNVVAGTSPKTLIAGTDNSGVCTPAFAFAGATYLVAEHCEAATAHEPTVLSTFHVPAAWSKLDLTSSQTMLSNFTVDGAGTQVAVSDDDGLQVFPIGSATAKLIDASSSSGGLFAPAGTSILYAGVGGLRTAQVSATPSSSVLAAGLTGLYGLSPNGATVLGFENGDNGDSDMWIASATTAHAAARAGTGQDDLIQGDTFTSDSSHALFADNSGNSTLLQAFSVAGSTLTSLTSSSSLVYFAATGSKVVFGANPGNSSPALEGTADILSADTAGAAMPTLIASQANTNFVLSAAKDKIVYVWNAAQGAKAGLYVVPVP